MEQPLTEGSILGKFANVNELGKAYENLQSEFTRKAQQLAELQQAHASVAEEKPAVVEVEKPIDDTETIKEEMREEIIREYLTSVASKQTAPTVITTNNDFCIGSNPAPRSIREVGAIAENFFKNKETR